jgi:hypothetical protein
MLMRITSGFHLSLSPLEAAFRYQDEAHKTDEHQEWSVHRYTKTSKKEFMRPKTNSKYSKIKIN